MFTASPVRCVSGTFMPPAVRTQTRRDARQKRKTASCPQLSESQPPKAPPANSPSDCVVLYTPRARPLEEASAVRETNDGSDASKTLNPQKNAKSNNANPTRDGVAAANTAKTPQRRTTAPIKSAFILPARSAVVSVGIKITKLRRTAGR